MPSSQTERPAALASRLAVFVDTHVYPDEGLFHAQIAANCWAPPAVVDELKERAPRRRLLDAVAKMEPAK